MTAVLMRGRAAKALRQAPENVQIAFSVWKEEVQQAGISAARANPLWHDHPLKGNKAGRRSVYLDYSWRAEYVIDKATGAITVEVMEVHNHEY
jgi:proteic killer suppression protein